MAVLKWSPTTVLLAVYTITNLSAKKKKEKKNIFVFCINIEFQRFISVNELKHVIIRDWQVTLRVMLVSELMNSVKLHSALKWKSYYTSKQRTVVKSVAKFKC